VLTTLFLDVTSNISLVWVVMLARGGVAGGIAFSGGVVWGALLTLCRASQRVSPPRSEEPMRPPSLTLRIGVVATAAFFAGFLMTRGIVMARLGIPLTVVGAAVALAILSMSMLVAAGRGGLWRALPAGIGTAALASAVIVWGTYDPVRAARLLFSTDVFMAHHAGTEMRLLPFLDDGRFIDRTEGAHGTYTLWKNRGAQLNLRESGIPKGTYCVRTDFCPQYSGEIVPAVLPLVLHESPRRVLVLGIGSGSTLAACLQFPVEKVACLEDDGGLIDILARKVWPAAPNDPRSDNRLSIIETDPVLAVHGAGGEFDVIIALSDAPGIATGTPYFTREFYKGVARQLAADGIFAQRFQQVDFGPWPLESVLATMKSVFAEVAAVEGGPGDLVLLGTTSRQGLSRPGLLARFQSPQVVRTMAGIGWDWSVALNLAAYSGKGCDALLQPWPPINTSANGLFAFRLPQETMRWGPKGEEMLSALAPHAGRIAQWPNVDGNDPELLRRLADVVAQHKMMTSYPDQPWAYRKALREELTKNARTVIEDADDGPERKLNRVDRHRVRYLSALGKAAQMPRPTPEALHRVEEFAEPYDPVVTYFLHHELARLYGRAATPNPQGELGHRLYAIYYGDRADRSVRDIVDAIALIVADPRTLAAPERWDHLNALLEFMQTRWNNRGLTKPPSARIILNDLEKSIDASERAFAEMERLSTEIGVPADDWLARRDVVERALVRPLRSYRAQVLPYYLKEVEQADAAKNGRPAGAANAN
jgi:Spermine/spermidine synthase domain